MQPKTSSHKNAAMKVYFILPKYMEKRDMASRMKKGCAVIACAPSK